MVIPTGLSAVAARIYGVLPEVLASRLLPRRLRYRPETAPTARAMPRSDLALLIAPVNFAGQGYAWAQAMKRARPDVTAVSMAYLAPGSDYGFPVDVRVPASAYALSKSWHTRQLAAIAEGFTHVLMETGRSPAGAPYRQSVATQVDQLRRAGVKVGYLAHGTDVRVPSLHAAANPDSPFKRGDYALLERQARENIALIATMGLPAFVSTPDLLDFVPDATWLPVVVDPVAWRGGAPVLERSRPVVVHAPSSGPMKGSDIIDPVMAALDDDGVIEYRRIRGVPATEMPSVYREADIVLEQFRIGGYGVAACEAMAAGRVVVGHVTADVRHIVARVAGMPLPIVQATAASLRDTILEIVRDRATYTEVASQGPAFVRQVHDGRESAAVLRTFVEA